MKPARYSEDKLIKQFNKGDRQALTRVYDMWFSNLCYFAYRVTGDMAEAEDITVTTMQSLLSRHERFETMSNIKAFLYITARNKCLKYLQSEQKQKASHKEMYELHGEADEYVLAQMIKAEMMKEIYKEIENLPPNRKDVFKLFYIEGLDVSEIADKLKMTPGAVSTAKFRALEQLRNIIYDKKLLPAIGIILVIREVFF
ncbi:sigma-70 family RNA polymerase sigma factor [Niastella caeni]|uniref:Sigma-70 family RNA polymerase sigma factor n=1 Tax=Niastella caeni TaxID=2569763 RepID=A0A4S8HV91_9BACT|nr:sigma-70 family RNA polymerase sigma factor [Niastella caeni]THU39325.1 sigma-70 family RNA polymerase sigma factor [Niastella caeni]